MKSRQYTEGSRWVSPDCRVWEKRDWGWKFLGFAKSLYPGDVIEVLSTDCDHPFDVFHEEFDERGMQ